MTAPETDVAWHAAGVFRPLLHKADFTAPAWRFDDWTGIWFARCRCPVTRLWGDTPAGRERCPDCERLNTAASMPPAQRGPHG